MLRNALTGKRAEVSSQAQFPSNIITPLPNMSLISHTHLDLIKAGLVLSSPSPNPHSVSRVEEAAGSG